MQSQSQAESGSQAGTTGVEEIIVTAQRIGENLQDVPIAVTALSAAALEARGLTNNQSLEGAIPSLTMTKSAQSNQPYLRGVGSNGAAGVDEMSVATYLDGFYIASPLSNQYNFNNLARIEVLKGPQGTLFGRNATGGVIQLITKEPTQERQAQFDIGYGNYQTIDVNGYVSGGLAPGLAVDLAVQHHNQLEGYGVNLGTGTDVYLNQNSSVRSKWVYTGSSTKITLLLNYDRLSSRLILQNTPEADAAFGTTPLGRFNGLEGVDPQNKARRMFAGLRVEQDLGFANLISASMVAKYNQRYGRQRDPGYPLGEAIDEAMQYSQEFLLQGKNKSGIQWQAGAYFFDYSSDIQLILKGSQFAPLNPEISATGKTSSSAIFAQVTYEIVPSLKITGGLRYTWDKYETRKAKTFLPSLNFTATSPDRVTKTDNPTWRLALDYQIGPDIMAYVSYNRGIKSGGYSIYAPNTPKFDPEKLDAYEVGLKTQLFDNAVRFNVAGFYYDYANLQVNTIIQGGLSSQILNAASARIYGIDADFEVVPFRNFTLSGGFGILDAKYRDFPGAPSTSPNGVAVPGGINAAGNYLVNAPKFSASLSGTYVIPSSLGDFRVSGTVSHKGRSFATADNLLAFPSYTLVSALLGWTNTAGAVGIDLWASNLTDERYYIQKTATGTGWSQLDGPPRTYGARLKAKF
ncbi:hypothetical protein A8G00_22820 [Sphingobium sp. SA916]|nr:hypothetical protein A8G00_22820 [Sphingobium sp. SA916]